MLLRQMKYFLAAVYCKSFNEAAKQCFISQPSFSLQIKQLEKELGVKLINRNNCSFSLTPAGEKFYDPCKRIVGDVQNLLQNMQRLAEKEQLPHYIIGCKTGYNVCRLLNIINTLNKHTDLYHLEIIYGDHEQLMSTLKNKEIDIVLSEDRPSDIPHLLNETIEIAELYACIANNSPLIEKPFLELTDLAEQICVLIANREYSATEQEYYAKLLDFHGSFFIVRDITAALTKVIDSQSKAFLPITSNSDAPMYFHNFTKLLPLVHNSQQLTIDYKLYWLKDNNKQLTAIAQHIISLMLDH